MTRTIAGIIVAAIVLYVWGFIYWGMGPYRELIWKQTIGDAAAQRALLKHFPREGTYFIPGMQDDPKETEALYQSGPLAMVHMLSIEGQPVFDSNIMIKGFCWNLLIIVLIAVWLHRLTNAVPCYRERVGLVMFAGLIASVGIDGSAVIWWRMDWPWKLYQGLYDLSVFVIVGVILAAFIKPSASPIKVNVESTSAAS
ncbi:MAG: hypothetical protein ACKVT0_13990 [Planctomycetaceae bacterium]